ncbi:unnamed protein product, partial [Phaeothamnion confervicola]
VGNFLIEAGIDFRWTHPKAGTARALCTHGGKPEPPRGPSRRRSSTGGAGSSSAGETSDGGAFSAGESSAGEEAGALRTTTGSKKCDCPFLVRLSRTKDGVTRVAKVDLRHNAECVELSVAKARKRHRMHLLAERRGQGPMGGSVYEIHAEQILGDVEKMVRDYASQGGLHVATIRTLVALNFPGRPHGEKCLLTNAAAKKVNNIVQAVRKPANDLQSDANALITYLKQLRGCYI